MASLNKVIIIGNLGKDPEMRYAPSGDPIANFSVATTDTWKDKQGEKQERTEWHRITIFGKLAEIAGQYLKKGSSVYLEGRIQTRSYEQEGVTKYSTDLIMDRMQMLGGRSDADGSEQSSQAPRSEQRRSGSTTAQRPSGFEDFEDDAPF